MAFFSGNVSEKDCVIIEENGDSTPCSLEYRVNVQVT